MIYIGVVAGFFYPDSQRNVFSHKSLAYFVQEMAQYLSRMGVMPILIPSLPDAELKQYLDFVDGVVFQGGSDVSPKSYQEEAIENGRWQGDLYRDQFELKIMDYAFKKRLPIFAICRGFQVANVYFGGTLYQDLQVQTESSVEHRNYELYDQILHKVECPADGILAKIYGKTEFNVNSVHHQGIKTLGKDLIVDAICPGDQTIEAFYYKDMDTNYFMGVQWHPEFNHTLSKHLENSDLLYDHFLSAVNKRQRKQS